MRCAAHTLRAPRGATSMPQRAKVCRRIVSRANDVGQRRQRRRYHCPGASRPTREMTVIVVVTFGSGDHPPPPQSRCPLPPPTNTLVESFSVWITLAVWGQSLREAFCRHSLVAAVERVGKGRRGGGKGREGEEGGGGGRWRGGGKGRDVVEGAWGRRMMFIFRSLIFCYSGILIVCSP